MNESSTVLPEDFDGVFRFTNPSEEDFIGYWGGIAYPFPALKTTPMLIRNATPEEVQNIRKKFAKKLAEREYFKSSDAKSKEAGEKLNNMPQFGSIHQAASYSESELTRYIQQCLEPLPTAKASAFVVQQEPIEDRLSKDEEGNLRTEVVDKKMSLKKKALES